MEVISAIATICQLLDFGHKLFVGYREVSGAADGIIEEHDRVEKLADLLLRYVELLKAQQAILGDDLDRYHASLCSRATSLAEEVSAVSDAVRVRGKPGKWNCMKSTIRAMGMEKKFERLEQRLGQLSREVEMEWQKLESRKNREAQDRANLMLSKSLDEISRIQQQQTIQLIALNRRMPRDYGYEWEASDRVFVDDGLGPTYPFSIDLCTTIKDFLTVMGIKFRSRKLPGTKQLERGHIAITDASGQTLFGEDNWNANVVKGTTLRISFIVGRWHGLNYSKCARCRKPYASEYKVGEFKTCNSCDLRILLVEPDRVSFEPMDMILGMDKDVYRDYKQKSRGRNPPRQDRSKTKIRFPDQPAAKNSSEEPSIDLVCRSLIAKWEPILNVVYRYVFCRCVVRLSTPSRSRFDPEVVSLVYDVCPRHNVTGVRRRDYGDLISNRDDPYFDQYGGYDVFRAILSLVGAAAELGDFAMPAGEISRVLGPVDRETRRRIFDELRYEVNECLLRYGFEIPAASVEHVKQRQQRSEKSRFALWCDKTPDPFPGLMDAPLFKELREILAGEWDGRPHWSVG
ncbi:hypothetical protein LQW54_012556 [Pestalotiopsis sp. IQ-011]